MLKFMAVVISLLVLAVGVSAQDGPPRLRVPTAEEYLEATSVLEFDQERERWVIFTEIFNRYREDLSSLDYELLTRSFFHLAGTSGHFYQMFPGQPGQDIWEQARVLAWFRENNIDLATEETIEFDDFIIAITPVDFNGDNSPEYILFVERPMSGYQAMLLIEPTRSGNFRLIETPLPWLSYGYGQWAEQSGQLRHLDIRDITGDDIPEWLVTSVGGEYRGVNSQLHLLGWRDGKLVELASPGIFVDIYLGGGGPDITKLWPDIDSDRPQFEIRNRRWDNFYCNRAEVTVYHWDGDSFVGAPPYTEYEPSLSCATRLAEIAMEAGDYPAAIENYALAIEREPEHQAAYYIRIRLALAYALSGDLDSAGETIAELHTWHRIEYPPQPYEMGEALWNAAQSELTAENLCRAAYDFVLKNPLYLHAKTGFAVIGRLEDYPFDWVMYEGPLYPDRAGCNITRLLNIQPTPYPTITPDGMPTYAPIPDAYHDIDAYGDLLWKDYDSLLEGLDSSDSGYFFGNSLLYVRALALEGLGREDEAAVQYALIAADETYPDWAALAALHLEPNEGQ